MLKPFYDNKYICKICSENCQYLCTEVKNDEGGRTLFCTHDAEETSSIFKLLTINDYFTCPLKKYGSCCKHVLNTQIIAAKKINRTEFINVSDFRSGKLCNFIKLDGMFCLINASHQRNVNVTDKNGNMISLRDGRCKEHLWLEDCKGEYKNTKRKTTTVLSFNGLSSASACASSASSTSLICTDTASTEPTCQPVDSKNDGLSSASAFGGVSSASASSASSAEQTCQPVASSNHSKKSSHLCKFAGCNIERNYGFRTEDSRLKVFCKEHMKDGMVCLSIKNGVKKGGCNDRTPAIVTSLFLTGKKRSSFHTQKTLADGNCCFHSVLFAYLSFHSKELLEESKIKSYVYPLRKYCCDLWKGNWSVASLVLGGSTVSEDSLPENNFDFVDIGLLKLLAYTLQFNILYILTDTGSISKENGKKMLVSHVTAENNPYMILQWDAVHLHVEILFHDIRNPASHVFARDVDIGSKMCMSPFKIFHFTKVEILYYFGQDFGLSPYNLAADAILGTYESFMKFKDGMVPVAKNNKRAKCTETSIVPEATNKKRAPCTQIVSTADEIPYHTGILIDLFMKALCNKSMTGRIITALTSNITSSVQNKVAKFTEMSTIFENIDFMKQICGSKFLDAFKNLGGEIIRQNNFKKSSVTYYDDFVEGFLQLLGTNTFQGSDIWNTVFSKVIPDVA
jgi:hypothetical protein